MTASDPLGARRPLPLTGRVDAAFREKLKERHPDHGGTKEQFTALQDAREAMLNKVSQ